jgi:hypothetical protein
MRMGLTRTRTFVASLAVAGASAGLVSCGSGSREPDACSNRDGALNSAAFVFVQTPGSGERVASGFRVSGCAATFEATVGWRLRGRDGRMLAKGFTQGGSRQPGAFAFTVAYALERREVGRLEVSGPRVTGEGFPPPADVVPLVLEP